MKYLRLLCLLAFAAVGTAGEEGKGKLEFLAVEHASFVMKTKELVIYVDPVGAPERYVKAGKPALILITHGHGDHLDSKALKSLMTDTSVLIAPAAVTKTLGYGQAMKNGDTKTVKGVAIEAVGAYNLTKERLKFHPKGVGNGYVLTVGGARVYISGDTEDVPEMRELKNIDYAFVCMNLPYTMTIQQAADAVLAFKPKVVFPYHYRGRPKMSDVKKFEGLVTGKNADIKVRFLDWYGDRSVK